ncbi:hypothetical protein ACSQ67_024895 [Phaseolus vulgaris]
MIYSGPILTRRGASRICHALNTNFGGVQQPEAGRRCEHNIRKEVVFASRELELGATRLAEVEKADAEKAAEIARLGKAPEEAERREVTLGRGDRFPTPREGGGEGWKFDQKMEVFNGRLVPMDEVQHPQSADQPAPSEDVRD